METPLQLSFHHMDAQPELEARIRARVERLERFAGDPITYCQIFVEKAHTGGGDTDSYEVHIEVRLPGADVAVRSRPRDRARTHQSLDVAVNAAFSAAERKLRRRNQRRRQQVKAETAPLMGRIVEIDYENGFGQIAATDGRLVYFHRNSVADGSFDVLEAGGTVELVTQDGDKGPQASTVKPIRPMRFNPDQLRQPTRGRP